MSTEPLAAKRPATYWLGWVLGVLPCLLLVMSGVMKIAQPGDFLDQFTKMGYPAQTALAIGVVELVCTALYLIPQTAVLGAILLTGYMGGAIATHVRVEEMFVVQFLIGVVLWLGLYLREPRLRALLPMRKVG
jgi:uncharacterized membrane protein YphA (DoxX/SURF4 family)